MSQTSSTGILAVSLTLLVLGSTVAVVPVTAQSGAELRDGDILWNGHVQHVTVEDTQNATGVVIVGHDSEYFEQDSIGADDHVTVNASELPLGQYELRVQNTTQTVAFTVAEQSLTVATDKTEGTANEAVNVSVDSNRAAYDLVVESEQWNATQLEAYNNLADVNHRYEDVDADGDDEYVIEVSGATDYLFRLPSDPVHETVALTFTVLDTGVSTTETLTIDTQSEAVATFEERTHTVTQGYYALVNVSLDGTTDARLDIIGPNEQYTQSLRLVDRDGDGLVRLDWPTFDDDITAVGEDTVEPANTSTAPSTTVLDTGSYELSLRTGATWTAGGGGPSDDAFLTAGTETDVGVLDVSPPDEVKLRLGRLAADALDLSGAAGEYDLSAAQQATLDAIVWDGATSTVAAEDYLVVSLQSETHVVTLADRLDDASILDIADDGLFLTLTHENPGLNADPAEYSRTGLRDVVDPTTATAYGFIRPADLPNMTVGQTISVAFTHTNASAVGQRGAEPYTTTASYTVVAGETVLDNEDDATPIQVAPTADARVTGTSTYVPGTGVTVTARATGGNPFLVSNSTTLQHDGTFAVPFDFSTAIPGLNFSLQVDEQERRAAQFSTLTEPAPPQRYNVTVEVVDTDGTTLDTATVVVGPSSSAQRGTAGDTFAVENGTYTLRVDADGYAVGTTTITVDGADTSVTATLDAVAADPTPTPTTDPTPAPTTTAQATDTSVPAATDTGVETAAPTERSQATGPGFGFVVALVALVAAALLAARQQE